MARNPRSPQPRDDADSPPPPKIRYRVKAYTQLVELLQDDFWRPILDAVPADAAIYGYCVLSGLPPRDAALVALGEMEVGETEWGEILRVLDRDAAPVIRRGFLSSGINQFLLTRVMREVMEDPDQPAAQRLRAVELGLQTLGITGGGTPPPQIPVPQVDVQVRVDIGQRVSMEVEGIRRALAEGGGSGLQIPGRESRPAGPVVEGEAEEVDEESEDSSGPAD